MTQEDFYKLNRERGLVAVLTVWAFDEVAERFRPENFEIISQYLKLYPSECRGWRTAELYWMRPDEAYPGDVANRFQVL